MTHPLTDNASSWSLPNAPASPFVMGYGSPVAFLYIKAPEVAHGHVALELRSEWVCPFGNPADAVPSLVGNHMHLAMVEICHSPQPLTAEHGAVQMLAACAMIIARQVVEMSERNSGRKKEIIHCLITSYAGPTPLHDCRGGMTLTTNEQRCVIPAIAIERAFVEFEKHHGTNESDSARNPAIPNDIDGLAHTARAYILAPGENGGHVLGMHYTPDELYTHYQKRAGISDVDAMKAIEEMAEADCISPEADVEKIRALGDLIGALIVKSSDFDKAPCANEGRYIHYLFLVSSAHCGSDCPVRIKTVRTNAPGPLPPEMAMQVFGSMVVDASERHAISTPNQPQPKAKSNKILH